MTTVKLFYPKVLRFVSNELIGVFVEVFIRRLITLLLSEDLYYNEVC